LKQRRWHAGTLTYTYAGLMTLFFWLLWGDFSLNLKERSGPPTLQLLLIQHHASDKQLATLGTVLPQAMALLLAPIVSYKSDRHRGRWGRRIPFLLAQAPLGLIAMLGLAYSPAIGAWIARVVGSTNTDQWIIRSFGVFWGVFEVCTIVTAYVVLPGLIADVVPKEMLGRFYGMFRSVSLGAGILFFFFLMGKIKTHYVPFFIAIGAIYTASFILMALKVKEGNYPPPPTVDSNEPGLRQLFEGIVDYFRESFGNPYYYWFFASFSLAAMAFTPINTFSVAFSESVGLSNDSYGKLSALQLFLSFAQAYAVGWLCDRYHPLRMTIIALVLFAITTFFAFFLVKSAFMFGVAHVICGSCAGFWLTATAPLGPALLPKSRFTQFLSANHICTASGVMVVSYTCGIFLDRMHHDYRFIYLWACVFISASALVTFVLYQRFMQLGGPKGYVAPE
jgi:MFS family permease